jgi:hypothetical protein
MIEKDDIIHENQTVNDEFYILMKYKMLNQKSVRKSFNIKSLEDFYKILLMNILFHYDFS